MQQPTSPETLMIYLAMNRRVLVRMPPTCESPNGRKFECWFLRFAEGAITFIDKDKKEVGPIPISRGPGVIQWLPTCFTRTVGIHGNNPKTAHYYYTGEKPWLKANEKLVAEWDIILNTVGEK